MINRYKFRTIAKNDLEMYFDVFRKRGINHVSHYMSPNFSYVNKDQYKNLIIIKHTWQEGDRYYKLAEKYYGDATDWWIIAKFNLKPTEAHLQVGDVLDIPTPLNLVLNYMTG